jgi:MFS family permease
VTGTEESDMRNVYALGAVSFFTDVSSEMVFSLLPVFILSLPGGSRALLGLIEGTAEALSYCLRAVSGYFSDRFRRRKAIVLTGYALSNAVKPLFATASTALDAFVIRVADRVGKGVRTAPRDALISESVPGGRRGTAFGVHRTLDQLGAILGPVIASAAMLALGMTARGVFWLSLIPGTAALLVILLFVRERAGGAGGGFRPLVGLRGVLTTDFTRLLLVVGLFSIGAFNFSFVLLNAREFGVGEPLIPIVYAVVNLTHTAVAIPAGALSDKIGKERVLIVGYGVFLAAALLLNLSPVGVPAAYLIAAVFGLYMGVVETVQRALVPGYAGPSLRGTAYGVYYLVVGSAFFVANAVVGALWELYGSTAASLYSVASSMIAIVAMLVFLKKRGKSLEMGASLKK